MQRDRLIENWFNGSQALQRLWRHKYYADLGAEGLTIAQVSVLTYLQENQPASSKQIVSDLHTSKSAVAQLLDGVEKLQFIVRHDDPTDRRVTYISLSKQGSDKIRAMNIKLKSHFENLSEVLSDGELIAMAEIQEKLLEQLKRT